MKENVSQGPFVLRFCLLPILRWGAPYLPFLPLTLFFELSLLTQKVCWGKEGEEKKQDREE